ncbi:MAG: SDR family NAD(P)-dependent oxidoreductase [Pseudolabrys sp.]|nr:SDR family NAD(P)-dependent oxidoreductase [Pseudolabrys sp.]
MSLPVNLAIVATACRFPDANSPAELWNNVIEGRRSFRAIPRQRLDLARYAAAAIGDADSITPVRAGLLTGWRPDPGALRIPRNTFDATDLTHWLALDIARDAFAAIGGADRLDRARTAVVVANTLTGEFSRAALLRLRLPFLDDLLAEAIAAEKIADVAAARLRAQFAATLRQAFADPNEDSLAGGLANTIAGRIANHFDLHGGGYSVDGACASSLVAVADAGNLLITGQADAVLVAAVDLSLDPFELVGFSRNGALAAGEMRVFDARANGFWPGEGGGAVLLMREDNANALDLPVLARLRGWGLSSDGAGGLTRPSSEGQSAAYRRAYATAGVDPADVDYVEAHGTGTAIGDPTEVRALAALRDDARAALPIGSIKANIGHTKAAAGLAGLIKTVEALRNGVVPPHVGCDTPHGVFAEVGHRITPALTPFAFDAGRAAIAGVSSFGFGGINAHVVLEGVTRQTAHRAAPVRPRTQDAELFVFAGDTAADVIATIARLETRAPHLSMAELADAAANTAGQVRTAPMRAAVIARHGAELAARLREARTLIAAGTPSRNTASGVFVGIAGTAPRIALLFPGQAAPSRPDGGAWRRRFASSDRWLGQLPAEVSDPVATEIAQPAIMAASLAALDVLGKLGIEATIAAGHSLGEIATLAWAGALEPDEALLLAHKRGALIGQHGIGGGAMLRVAMPAAGATEFAAAHGVAVACINGERETVLSGPRAAIEAIAAQARSRGIETTSLKVSHAFHSQHMTPALEPWRAALEAVTFRPLSCRAVSTVTGDVLGDGAALRPLLVSQFTVPVRFTDALDRVAEEADIVIEAGPGEGLTRLAKLHGLETVSVDAFGPSLVPLLSAIATLFVAGAAPRFAALYADRQLRGFDPAALPYFLASPCAPREAAQPAPAFVPQAPAEETVVAPDTDEADPLALVRRAVADETQFADGAFGDDDRFLDTLHLNSLSVARIVTRAARLIGIEPPQAPTDFANATVRDLADALSEMATLGARHTVQRDHIAGVRPWVRRYGMRWREEPAPDTPRNADEWCVIGLNGRVDASEGDHGRILIWLPDGAGEDHAVALLDCCQDLARNGRAKHVAFCHAGLPVSAFARSIAQENRFASVQVIERATGHDESDVLPHLGATTGGFSEWRLDADGKRYAPHFVPLADKPRPARSIGERDVVVVTGGSSGIGAECALRLMDVTGASVALIGRRAASDGGVRQTLERAAAMGRRCIYRQADVGDAGVLQSAFDDIARELGPVTALLHAAGRNQPSAFDNLTNDELRATLAPKTQGLRHALAAAPDLRRVIVFGSIIGRLGLEGEAHYALANAMAADIAQVWARSREDARSLAVEWSAWAGLGMGERLGTIERLADRGVSALSVDDALDAFERLIRDDAEGTIAVCGRFGASSHATAEAAALPALRFVGQPLVYYPGTELVVETALATGRDPYLADHHVSGHAVLPGVIGLEAMAQVAGALSGHAAPGTIDNIAFESAVALPLDEDLTIRIAALTIAEGRVEAAIRAADDDFSAIRMRAVFTYGRDTTAPPAKAPAAEDLICGEAFYGSLLFQQRRFQGIAAYRHIAARRIVARLGAGQHDWFSAYEPQQLVLGNPAAHDAMLHALQAAVPHLRVLPVAIGSMTRFSDADIASIEGTERGATDREFTFDIDGYDRDGTLAQRWRDVTFRAIGPLDVAPLLSANAHLLAPYVERVARAAFKDAGIKVAIAAGTERHERRRAALAALGLARVTTRRDGKPLADDGDVSLAHGQGLTLAVKAKFDIACDIAAVAAFNGDESPAMAPTARAVVDTVARIGNEPADVAAARLWGMNETLRKLGARFEPKPKASCDTNPGCMTFETPTARVLTINVRGSGSHNGLVIAIGRTSARPARPPRLAAADNMAGHPAGAMS